jgi:hypothetical protein
VSAAISFAPNTTSSPATQASARSPELDTAKLAEIRQLAATDRHVRAHEEAHLTVAGPYATSGPSYTFTIGPDGQRYAVAGEVSLDASPDSSGPEATVQKAKIIEAAANAPVDPSTQDRMVAAQAAQMEADAELQISAQHREARSAYLQQDSPAPAQLISLIL